MDLRAPPPPPPGAIFFLPFTMQLVNRQPPWRQNLEAEVPTPL